MVMVCRATGLGGHALPGGAAWRVLLPACWHLQRILAALVPRGGCCSAAPRLEWNKLACRSVSAVSGNAGERKHLPSVQNTKSDLELTLPSRAEDFRSLEGSGCLLESENSVLTIWYFGLKAAWVKCSTWK